MTARVSLSAAEVVGQSVLDDAALELIAAATSLPSSMSLPEITQMVHWATANGHMRNRIASSTTIRQSPGLFWQGRRDKPAGAHHLGEAHGGAHCRVGIMAGPAPAVAGRSRSSACPQRGRRWQRVRQDGARHVAAALEHAGDGLLIDAPLEVDVEVRHGVLVGDLDGWLPGADRGR